MGADGAVVEGTGRRISVRDASIKTATVEVKALTISGKQMTMGVFRQLKTEDLLEERSACLKGPVWGSVNYFWGDCSPNHLHVVWQRGDELRRACIWREPERHMWFLQNLREMLHDVAVCDLLMTLEGRPIGDHITLADVTWRRAKTNELSSVYGHVWRTMSSYADANTIREAREKYSNSDALLQRLEECAAILARFRAEWRRQYDALETIDHLFIAV